MQRDVHQAGRARIGIAGCLRTALAGVAALVLFGGPAAQAMEYRLGAQDRVRIYVSEWPALTGELAVGPNGNVSLPVIGEVPAKGLLPSELASEIANRLRAKQNLRQSPDTSVDIVAYRPFYILGTVTTPGEYAYRPGMLVLNALSLSGGIYRSERISEWDLESTAINSRGQLKVLELRRADLTAEETRYQAQADGADALPAAPSTASADIVTAFEEQKRLFDAARQAYRNEREALETTLRLREGEIESLSLQLTDVETKLTAFEEELDKARQLAAQKLAVHRVLPLERDLSDVQREKKQAELEKLRAERSLEETRARIAELDGRYRSDALAGLQRVKAEVRSIEEQFETTSRLLDGAASYSDRLEQYTSAGSLPRLRFTIVRTTGETVEEIPATETTPVVPGDIIKVDRDAPEKSS